MEGIGNSQNCTVLRYFDESDCIYFGTVLFMCEVPENDYSESFLSSPSNYWHYYRIKKSGLNKGNFCLKMKFRVPILKREICHCIPV